MMKFLASRGLAAAALLLPLSVPPSALAEGQPDNGRLVFVRFGHVFTAQADGTDLRRLTRSTNNFEPVWSPDGRRIAYDHDHRGIWVMRANGGDKHKVVGLGARDPAWSPNGCRIAFTRGTGDDVGALYVKNLRTEKVRRVVRTTQRWSYAFGAAWSPNGRWIAFTRVLTPRGGPIRLHLFKVHPDGTGLTRLTFGIVDHSQPDWSPDGRRIAFVHGGLASSGALKVMRPDGRGVRSVLDMPGNESSPAWAPDGRRIVLFSSGDEQAAQGDPRPPHEGLWTVSPDGGHARYVVANGQMPDWRAKP